jgi:hypothetical protein
MLRQRAAEIGAPDLDARDAAPFERGDQATSHGLDLGQLGHAPS